MEDSRQYAKGSCNKAAVKEGCRQVHISVWVSDKKAIEFVLSYAYLVTSLCLWVYLCRSLCLSAIGACASCVCLSALSSVFLLSWCWFPLSSWRSCASSSASCCLFSWLVCWFVWGWRLCRTPCSFLILPPRPAQPRGPRSPTPHPRTLTTLCKTQRGCRACT